MPVTPSSNRQRSLRLAVAAGGTGGHVFPAEALARDFLRRGHRVTFVTETRGLQYLKDLGHHPDLHLLHVRLRRPGRFLATLMFAGTFFVCLLQVLGCFVRHRPRALVAFGGYPVLPALAAAFILRIPLILHEQNAWLGRANRWFAWMARHVALSFDETLNLTPRLEKRLCITGTPVRSVFARPFQDYHADSSSLRLFIMGGSQGARVFRDAVPFAIAHLPESVRARVHVVQQCRPEDREHVEKHYQNLSISCEVKPFFNDIPDQLDAADVVIARAGAATLAELTFVGRPVILVPYRYAMEDHQAVNADCVARSGAAWVVRDDDRVNENLASTLAYVLTHPTERVSKAQALKRLGKPDALDRLSRLVLGHNE